MPNFTPQGLLRSFVNKYRQADKALGGWLPGGGTANPLSGTVRSVNPGDIAGYGTSTGISVLGNFVAKKAGELVNSSSWGKNLKELPRVINAANQEMSRLGGGAWSNVIYPKPKITDPQNLVQINLNSTDLFGPHYNTGGLDTEGRRISISPDTPSWVAAHELGHAIDHLKRPGAFQTPNIDSDSALKRFVGEQTMRVGSPATLVFGLGSLKNDNRDRSFLGAGIEGALMGLGAHQDTLRKEINADRYGIPLAQKAKIPWDWKGNMYAKGTYLLNSAGVGFGQGIAGEIINRGVDTLQQGIRGGIIDPAIEAANVNSNSNLKNQLAKYGYNPEQYRFAAGANPGELRLQKRPSTEENAYRTTKNLLHVLSGF
jgi:hypothetical protein